MWKILTAQIREEMNNSLVCPELFPEQQKVAAGKQEEQVNNYIQSAEVKLGIFWYNNKLYYKTELILIKKKKKKIKDRHKTVNLLKWPPFFFNYCINMPSKRFACLQNRFFGYLIPFLLNSSFKRTNIWIGSCICFVFLSIPYSVIKRAKVWSLILFNCCPHSFLVDFQFISVLLYWRCRVRNESS